jgi:hypothetical protein
MKLKKFSLGNVSEKYSDKELKRLIGGKAVCIPTNCPGMYPICSGSCWADDWCAGCGDKGSGGYVCCQ